MDRWPPALVKALVASAVVLGTVHATSLAISIWPYVRPSSLKRFNRTPSGDWALVTGASDGIGKAFADELLARGFNVVLHGRNPAKLDALKQRLLQAYPERRVEVVVVDATAAAAADYDRIAQSVEELPGGGRLTVLVNNVGGVITSPQYVPLDEMSHEDIDTSINVNARFTTHLTASLLPALKRNEPSLVLNCGSLAGVTGMPYLVPYASTKGFIAAFSKSLKAEMEGAGQGKGVEVLGLLIGSVSTPAIDNDDSQASTISPKQCATGSLARVGCGRSVIWCHWRHAFLFSIMGNLPEGRLAKITGELLGKRREVEAARLKGQ
ncbi:NAD(P)-binding protein [Polychaeton citri CBS 116435]|uniref:NAD(P)-binding protein n=1 Tax=Polychaeton citri CBS 116435 TaxID=1314669 RepID=A0A9P4QIW0_9PEZI|nr:NAD(P)-binding protein [Polychaeton citri CBS 116435]